MLTWLFCLLLIEKCFAMHCPQRSPLCRPREDHHIVTIDTLSPDPIDPIQKDSCIGASTNTEAYDPERPAVHLAYSSNHRGDENPSTSIAIDNHPAEIEKMTRSKNSRTSSLQDPISLSPIPNVELISNESEQIANQVAQIHVSHTPEATDCPICFLEIVRPEIDQSGSDINQPGPKINRFGLETIQSERENDQSEIEACTHCHRRFHSECLQAWLKKKNTCPTCSEPDPIPVHSPQEIVKSPNPVVNIYNMVNQCKGITKAKIMIRDHPKVFEAALVSLIMGVILLIFTRHIPK
ncbi:hypothetical protein PGT21_005001 [Puccinia graminis f. sp. tritici]|uniref:RING-type domain-containing protein n=1 Tax=Puccinia graminis f. sp. tritici TaxID=56615 RepID=A0A5B0NNS1_PUCGR|nr:hypothetical protein PGT21_005001 [Puccinia graminis f. sp. tritici]KAA1090154.1 hypothetical protein PGTUg99_036633 [Puccinia graminis f. sp. tritici]